ncbi:MAG: Heat shock protein Hsp20 [candidate division TA06 bacterium 32_111]|uniref:Heat shock protein Hsp20 n=2 Tax=Bacteria candidate phyla TaxID=1783234 RepID=A0A101I4A4_UNCT6|nr:MAG: Heat shock protein Hsp20 [candidate division TA06 bacterium 32_111]KUK88264.1 MAG: Heat shock protein Hsp20 [candidate division TA06 bacterium 34_109]
MKKEIQKFSPFSELFDLRKEIDALFDDRFFGKMLQPYYESNWTPSMDISETDKEFFVTVELPGLKKEDITLSIDNNVLTIEGERKSEKEEKGKTFHRIERSYGKFYRSVTLPKKVDEDNIKASFKDGLLNITIPKVEKEKVKNIEISDK